MTTPRNNDIAHQPLLFQAPSKEEALTADGDGHPPATAACDSSTSSSTTEASACRRAAADDSSNSSSSSKERMDRLEQLVDHGDTIDSSSSKHRCCSISSVVQVPPPPARRASLLRMMSSSCSIGSESPSCPICLDPMTPIDHQHPIQCPTRHCHFNFCVSCIHSLISSSKDDFEMASDGNAHVKVYLNCPNCRADLSTSIRDVLLLRKVDTVIWLLHQRSGYTINHNTTNGSNNNRLNPSQQRTQQAMQELHVQEAIQRARSSEKEFWKTHHREISMDDYDDLEFFGGAAAGDDDEDSSSFQFSSRRRYSARRSSGNIEYEEWGVEADLDNGVHSSIRLPPGQSLLTSTNAGKKKNNKKNRKSSHQATRCSGDEDDDDNDDELLHHKAATIDETLLMGLECCMTHAEQLQLTYQMTSGDPKQLAEAARMFKKIEEDARQGILPAHRQAMMNRRGSLYEIVEETRQLTTGGGTTGDGRHPKQTQQQQRYQQQSRGGAANPILPRQKQLQYQIAAERRQLDFAMVERQSLLERCPLPVRMPKAITLDLYYDPTSRNFPLRFCNDTWDGTVLDAYTKLTVSAAGQRVAAATGSPWQVTKKAQTQHPGVFYVLSQGQYKHHYGRVELTLNQPSRVLVASVQGAAGRQGVMKGDVVTHVDGEPFFGRATVDDLMALLQAKQVAGQKTVDMVLNAEDSVAEALKRRASVME